MRSSVTLSVGLGLALALGLAAQAEAQAAVDVAPTSAPAISGPVPGVDVPLVDLRHGWQLGPLGSGWRPTGLPGTLAAFLHEDGSLALVVRVPGPSCPGDRAPRPAGLDAVLRPRLEGYRRLWTRARSFPRRRRSDLAVRDVGFRAAGPVTGALRLFCHAASAVTFTVELPVAHSARTRARLEALLDSFVTPTR